MMKDIIPHLRVLMLPMDKLNQLSKYLSNSQMSYLTRKLTFKEENCAAKIPPSLNPSSSPRSRPKIRRLHDENFKLEFISKDFIKSDWEMMGLESKNNATWKTSQIKFVAEQHLFVKGIEILTIANSFPKYELAKQDNEESSRCFYICF